LVKKKPPPFGRSQYMGYSVEAFGKENWRQHSPLSLRFITINTVPVNKTPRRPLKCNSGLNPIRKLTELFF
jgi:hypothetical protein